MRDSEGLEGAQGREWSWEESGKHLRELGRLRSDLLALHSSLAGVRFCRTRGNSLELHQGRPRVGIGAISAWKEWLDIGRGCPHPWRWLWAGDRVGIGHSWHSVILQGFSNLRNCISVLRSSVQRWWAISWMWNISSGRWRTFLTPIEHPKNDIFPARLTCGAGIATAPVCWDFGSTEGAQSRVGAAQGVPPGLSVMFLNHLEGSAVAPSPFLTGCVSPQWFPLIWAIPKLLPQCHFWGEMWQPCRAPQCGTGSWDSPGRQGGSGAAGKFRSGVEAPPWWPIQTLPCQGGTSCGCASSFCHCHLASAHSQVDFAHSIVAWSPAAMSKQWVWGAWSIF